MYSYPVKVRLGDTDAAGVVYFTRFADWAHQAYEALLEEEGLSLTNLLAAGAIILPIVECRTHFLHPVRLGDRITVALTVGRIGESSFETRYKMHHKEGLCAGEVQIVHVVRLREGGSKAPMPAPLCSLLTPHLENV